MNGISDAISGTGAAIGRYFSVVSFIPSLFLVGFTYALIESGAWGSSGELDWAKAGNAFTHIGNLAFLTLLSVAIGIIVHPIQFALVQFFEGYWGTSKLAQRARVVRILHHRKRLRFFQFGPALAAQWQLQLAADREAKGEGPPLKPEVKVKDLSILDESERMADGYPDDDDDIMPTRLGNVLRRYERKAGSQYGLDAVAVIPHILSVGSLQRVEYVNDQRQQLDLSVRMSATSIVAALIATAFLWQHGLWLLIALIPYGIAYLSYRGAVTSAHEFGSAISTIIDLDRFALYDCLRMRRPTNTWAERRMNAQLMALLSHDPGVGVPYEHPAASDGADKGSKAT
jgi:hypothetical protein